MEKYKPYHEKAKIVRVHIKDVKINGRTERISWVHSKKCSVNLLITEDYDGKRVANTRVIADLLTDEDRSCFDAIIDDYVSRQKRADVDPIPFRRVIPLDLRIDDEIEFGENKSLFETV